MMKKIFTILGLCLATLPIIAQTCQWAKKAECPQGVYAHGIAIGTDGSSYVTGEFSNSISFGSATLNSSGGYGIYLAKYDPTGSLVWAKTAAVAADIYAGGIALDKSGNIFLTGKYLTAGSFGNAGQVALTSTGDFDVFVAKYDNQGQLAWAKSAGTAQADASSAIGTDANGNAYISGEYHLSTFPASAAKIFMAKYDANGNISWFTIATEYGNFHAVTSMKTDDAGNSYITGQFFNAITFPTDSVSTPSMEGNTFIIKFDNNGAVTWMRNLGGPGYCGGHGIDADEQGNVYVTGYYRGDVSIGSLNLSGPAGLTYDGFVLKCDKDGKAVWINKISGPSDDDRGMCISATDNGECIVGGNFSSTIQLNNLSLTSSGQSDVFIGRLSTQGSFMSAISCGGSQAESLGGMVVTAQHIYVTGTFMGNINFGTAASLTSTSGAPALFTADYSTLTTEINDMHLPDAYTLFPNPATDEINIKGLKTNTPYYIYDITGVVVQQGIASQKDRIIIKDLAAGTYTITLEENTIASSPIKFVKQ